VSPPKIALSTRVSCSQGCECAELDSHPRTRESPYSPTVHSTASGQAWLILDCMAVSGVSSHARWAQLARAFSCQCLYPNLLLREQNAQSVIGSRTNALSTQNTRLWSRNLYSLINFSTYLVAQEYFQEDFTDCDSLCMSLHSSRSTAAACTSYTESISLEFSHRSGTLTPDSTVAVRT
jgi:hypothetical protein